MSEQKIPIPAMLYNAAVGGHVTNSQQIIDEDYNVEQKDVNKEVLGVPYNATTPNGMGRIVLKKTDNFKEIVEAQTNGNTIFVIKYDYTLTGDVTIPANCVLKFEGGSISGAYTLTGQATEILAGNINCITCSVGGTFKGLVNAYWFGMKENNTSFDNGIPINKAATVSRYLYIPNGTYYFQTPIVFDSMYYVDSHAYFKYNGSVTNGNLIEIVNNGPIFNTGEFHLNMLENISPSTILSGDITSVIGVCVRNISNCLIYPGYIRHCNECLRITNDNGSNTAGNTIYDVKCYECNIGIRIHQKDSSGGNRSSTNQNSFIGGVIFNRPNLAVAIDNPWRIRIEGERGNDSYDRMDGLTVIGMDLSSDITPIYARNIYGCNISARFEGASFAVEFHGNMCFNNNIKNEEGIVKPTNSDDSLLDGLCVNERRLMYIKDITTNPITIRKEDCNVFRVGRLKKTAAIEITYTKDSNGNTITRDGTIYPQPKDFGRDYPDDIVFYSSLTNLFETACISFPTNVNEMEIKIKEYGATDTNGVAQLFAYY